MSHLGLLLIAVLVLAAIYAAFQIIVADGGNWLFRKLGFKSAGAPDRTAANRITRRGNTQTTEHESPRNRNE